MPPPWGRPPEGLDPRARQEWERRVHEWELSQGSRFEEVDSDNESVDSAAYARYMGYSGPSRTRNVPAAAYADLAYGEEDEEDEEDVRGAEWQLAMREKEEELAERALRRIRRARLRGENNVDLSREELDALERRRAREEIERRPPARVMPPKQQARAPAKSQNRSSGSIWGMGGSPKSKPTKGERRVVSVPLQDAEPGSQHALPPISSSSSLQRITNTSPRASRRSSKTRLGQSEKSLHFDLPSVPNNRPNSSRGSRRGDGSPTRSLPDDPDWSPRSRSSSSLVPYPNPPYPTHERGIDPFAYQMHESDPRRSVSDPNNNVTYAGVRRNPPRQAALRSRDPASIADSDEDELAGSGDSDEGVRVDVVPTGRVAYQPPASAGASRPRRGGKR